jgi:hypothetical protein
VSSLVIDHRPDGTLVRGTLKEDRAVGDALSRLGFRWSKRLDAWDLPRPWSYDTRTQRVTSLRHQMTSLGRSIADSRAARGPADSAAADSAARGFPVTPSTRITPGSHNLAAYPGRLGGPIDPDPQLDRLAAQEGEPPDDHASTARRPRARR